MYIIWAVLGFSLLIIVHELGHFIMAKVNGIRVEEFSIGMGPEVYSHKGKETQYSLRLLPIGGYVKMMGEDEAVDDERSFSNKAPIRRLSVILAGAFMNVVLAFVAYALVFNNIGFSTNTIQSVVKDSAAEEVGLKPGDKLLRINGSKIYTKDEVTMAMYLNKGEAVDLQIERNGEKIDYSIEPKLVTTDNGQYRQIGFAYDYVEKPTFAQTMGYTYKQTVSTIKQTYYSFKLLVTGKLNLKTDIGGPVTMIRMSGKAAKSGFQTLGYFLGLISINLAVFNLLPVPALDGGWALLILIELITKRKVPDKIVGAMNSVGFILLMGLMLVVTLKDIIFPVAL